MECEVDRLQDTAFGAPTQHDDAPLFAEDLDSYPTPSEIVGQIALVIAVCLGLGLLARLLVSMVGIY